jgi:hypothetical protein
MSDTHEVISAFLDDEPFDAAELVGSLSDPSGRAVMIDLVALRHLVQPDERLMTERPEPRSAWRAYLAAAAVVVALLGGYVIGERRAATETTIDPPAATRVVQAAEWQPVPEGGAR